MSNVRLVMVKTCRKRSQKLLQKEITFGTLGWIVWIFSSVKFYCSNSGSRLPFCCFTFFSPLRIRKARSMWGSASSTVLPSPWQLSGDQIWNFSWASAWKMALYVRIHISHLSLCDVPLQLGAEPAATSNRTTVFLPDSFKRLTCLD